MVGVQFRTKALRKDHTQDRVNETLTLKLKHNVNLLSSAVSLIGRFRVAYVSKHFYLSILCCYNSIPHIIILREFRFTLELTGCGNRIFGSRHRCLIRAFFFPPCMAETEDKERN